MDPYARDRIEGWIGDFVDSASFSSLPSGVQEYAREILMAFLERGCAGGVEVDELTETQLRPALLEGAGALALPATVRDGSPDLCGAFLEYLEESGRLGGGRGLGQYVRALRPAFREATAEKPKPIESVTSKLGRNDPCPCGSGRKYKKCCMRLLDD